MLKQWCRVFFFFFYLLPFYLWLTTCQLQDVSWWLYVFTNWSSPCSGIWFQNTQTANRKIICNDKWIFFLSSEILCQCLTSTCVSSEYWCSSDGGSSYWLRGKCPKHCWVTHCSPPHNSWQIVGSPPSSRMIQWLTRRQAEWVAFLSQHLKPSGNLWEAHIQGPVSCVWQ